MIHACVQRFDVTENLEKFCKILETKQALNSIDPSTSSTDTWAKKKKKQRAPNLYRGVCH